MRNHNNKMDVKEMIKYCHNDYIFFCSCCQEIKVLNNKFEVEFHSCGNCNLKNVIYVYDLGKFIFENFDRIKDPIHILQIPYQPDFKDALTLENPCKVLSERFIDIMYPLQICDSTFPCKHTVYVHFEDTNVNQWYLIGTMNADQIGNYSKFVPKSYLRNHLK